MGKNTKLPALSELHYNSELATNLGYFKTYLNKKPAKDWVKQHPMLSAVKYLPIGTVETLMDKLFTEWRVEVISFQALFQSVAVHVRIHYVNPVTGEWSYTDGLGAVGMQTDKGKSAADLAAIKQDAIMKALPAAKSYAIKDAVHHLGDIFGRNLNRDGEQEYTNPYDGQNKADSKERERLIEWLNSSTLTIANLTDFADSEHWAKYANDEDVISVFNSRMNEL
jgi:hypothetical protein